MRRLEFVLTVTPGLFVPFAPVTTQSNQYILNHSHFHLTNYIQEGTNIHDFLKIMGDKVGRSTLFGIPLQQHGRIQ